MAAAAHPPCRRGLATAVTAATTMAAAARMHCGQRAERGDRCDDAGGGVAWRGGPRAARGSFTPPTMQAATRALPCRRGSPRPYGGDDDGGGASSRSRLRFSAGGDDAADGCPSCVCSDGFERASCGGGGRCRALCGGDDDAGGGTPKPAAAPSPRQSRRRPRWRRRLACIAVNELNAAIAAATTLAAAWRGEAARALGCNTPLPRRCRRRRVCLPCRRNLATSITAATTMAAAAHASRSTSCTPPSMRRCPPVDVASATRHRPGRLAARGGAPRRGAQCAATTMQAAARALRAAAPSRRP